MKGRVLLVDDDGALRLAVKDRLEHWGLEVDEAIDGQAALATAQRKEFDLILLDLAMPGMGGMEVLRRLEQDGCSADVIVLTAHGSIETAVEALRNGASDFLQKPADFELLRARAERVLDGRRKTRLVQALSDRVQDEAPTVIGDSAAMTSLLETAQRAAASNATILITGESGTGKQVLAEFVHANSARRDGPFVYLNCVALSDDLVESTLFGHEKGAFTGAVARKQGRIELAAGGTAFLDEIGDTSVRLQTKLLHFLESGEYERVGGTRTLATDCRIVAATNRDLPKAIEEEKFRADLYYRLHVIQLEVPPLRERPEDVPLLARAFVDRFAKDQKRGAMTVADGAMQKLRAWRWPGNVRELKNVIERMVVLAPGDVIEADGLPPEISRRKGGATVPVLGDASYSDAVQAFKRSYIAQALKRTNGNQTQAAELLGMQRSFLNRLVKELGLRDEEA